MSTTPIPPSEPNRITALETVMQELFDRVQGLLRQVALAAPIGAVVAYAGDTIPSSWLPCDGRSLQRSQYASLFAAIGTIYGTGLNADTGRAEGDFNLPDYRGYFLRGIDPGTERDPDRLGRQNRMGEKVGSQVGSIQSQSTRLPERNPLAVQPAGNHQHSIILPQVHPRDSGNLTGLSGTTLRLADDLAVGTTEGGAHTHALTGGDNETRPINVYVHWIIKVE